MLTDLHDIKQFGLCHLIFRVAMATAWWLAQSTDNHTLLLSTCDALLTTCRALLRHVHLHSKDDADLQGAALQCLLALKYRWVKESLYKQACRLELYTCEGGAQGGIARVNASDLPPFTAFSAPTLTVIPACCCHSNTQPKHGSDGLSDNRPHNVAEQCELCQHWRHWLRVCFARGRQLRQV